MKKYHQQFEHDPENGIIGDCFRTSVACVLEVLPDKIDHVHAEKYQEMESAINASIADLGYKYIEFPVLGDIDNVLDLADNYLQDTYWFLSGQKLWRRIQSYANNAWR